MEAFKVYAKPYRLTNPVLLYAYARVNDPETLELQLSIAA